MWYSPTSRTEISWTENHSATAVNARHVFYNNSALDGDDPLAGESDDDAIAAATQDLLPGQHNPYYDVYNMSRGRYLGGLGQTPVQPSQVPPSSDAGVSPADYQSQVQRAMKDYPNELDSLSAEDDVQGNGIFDANDTHGNIHPDDGVFSDRESLPGYVARERWFQPSEACASA